MVEFKKLCESAQGGAREDTLQAYGDLINASHESLRDLYDCTVDSVDRLQELCLECGSLGSRQTGRLCERFHTRPLTTGGGWGGAVVSLVPVESVGDFLVKVKASYPAYKGLSEDALNQAAFATAPGCGAGGEFDSLPSPASTDPSHAIDRRVHSVSRRVAPRVEYLVVQMHI